MLEIISIFSVDVCKELPFSGIASVLFLLQPVNINKNEKDAIKLIRIFEYLFFIKEYPILPPQMGCII